MKRLHLMNTDMWFEINTLTHIPDGVLFSKIDDLIVFRDMLLVLHNRLVEMLDNQLGDI